MSNLITLCDEFGSETGSMDKILVHQKGLLHKAFSVFVVKNGQMLIQRRARIKYHSAGLWSNACCSHYIPDKRIDEILPQRVKEELGCKCDSYSHLFDFRYKTSFSDSLFENEYDCVFLANIFGEIIPAPNEVESYKWVAIDALKYDVKKNEKKYTYWFVKCYLEVLNKIL